MNNKTTEIKVNETSPEFVSFLAAIKQKGEEYQKAHYPSLGLPVFQVQAGHRYIRIFRDNSCHVFIDRTNGDVLMPAGCKAPAKHARGNIFATDNGLDCMGPYGPQYMKGPAIKF